MSSTANKEQKNILLLCLLLTPLMTLGLDIYTPSLPAITDYFHVSPFATQLTIILYIAGFGIAQPFVGIIADHVERKSFILTALLIYGLSSWATAFSPNIPAMCVFRIINSICAACASTSIKVLLSENFEGKMLAKANNFYVMGWSLTPIFAPLLGGYLQHYFNWQTNFYFMGAYGFIGALICMFALPRKKMIAKSNHTLFTTTVHTWKQVLQDKIYIAGVLILSIENASLFLYYTVAPFIIQTTLHYNAADYGKIVLFLGVSYIIGAILNSRLLNYFNEHQLVRAGLIASCAITFLFVCGAAVFQWNVHPTIYAATIPIFLVFVCDGMVFSNVMSRIIARYKHSPGKASGLLSGLLNIVAAFIVYVCSHWLNLHHLLTLSTTYFILFCGSLLALRIFR